MNDCMDVCMCVHPPGFSTGAGVVPNVFPTAATSETAAACACVTVGIAAMVSPIDTFTAESLVGVVLATPDNVCGGRGVTSVVVGAGGRLGLSRAAALLVCVGLAVCVAAAA